MSLRWFIREKNCWIRYGNLKNELRLLRYFINLGKIRLDLIFASKIMFLHFIRETGFDGICFDGIIQTAKIQKLSSYNMLVTMTTEDAHDRCT